MKRQKPTWPPTVRPDSSTTGPGSFASPDAAQELAVVVAAEEARLLALGPASDGKPGRLGLRPRLLLRLTAEREPEPAEAPGRERGEHVALILGRVGGARDREPPIAVDDPSVVARRETGGPDPPGEAQQLVEAEAAVAAHARVRRLPAGVAACERGDDGAPELLAQVEGHVREPEPVAGLARRDHRGRRAADPLARLRVRVDPEPERNPDGAGAGLQQGDRAVDAAAHRDRDPLRVARGADRRPDRVGERVDGERLAAHGRRLEQRQAGEVALEPGCLRGDDRLAVDLELHRGPFAAARGIPEEPHRASVAPPVNAAAGTVYCVTQ